MTGSPSASYVSRLPSGVLVTLSGMRRRRGRLIERDEEDEGRLREEGGSGSGHEAHLAKISTGTH